MLTRIEFFPDIKDLNVDQGIMQSFKNQKSFGSMHQQNCNQSFFADEDQIRSQSSLQVLTIYSCDKLICSGLGLRYLSSLQTLIIHCNNEFAHVAHELSFLTSLQYLTLHKCLGLKSLPEGIGNLTSLRELSIYDCPEMASLPRELQHLSALKELFINRCHPSLEIRCTKDTGEDWDKIQHIPHIKIYGREINKVIGILWNTIVLILFHHMQEGEDLLEPGIEGDEDYKLVPQYDYNVGIHHGQDEDV
ncbi:hypothetical protein CKAN_00420700 [Cinnamomum micranthum f. kanehirae]|uniref:Disease resistance R13L4/SHOC-2-like LRR domain-containing protein n=1 Tax=Cinnamomum micranthum f. kanehirae TaxID=337451 RepID=A0A3S3PYB2_9MAGN|nr:hypothetical protein CKAN_00420700 [Cinnamomum micranthum f. kanehirae]